MNDPSAVLDRPTAADVCGCFADAPPLPMGCAACGHAPYAHGCPGQASDHDYTQPSGELMAERLWVRRELSLGRALPTFEPAREVTAQPTLVPAPRQAGPEATPSRTRPAGRTDTRRPATPTRPHRPVETRADRAARLALARDPLARRRARTAARAHEHNAPPPSVSRELTTWPPLTLLLTPPEHQHQTPRPGLAVALGRGRSPDASPLQRHDPHRQEAAA